MLPNPEETVDLVLKKPSVENFIFCTVYCASVTVKYGPHWEYYSCDVVTNTSNHVKSTPKYTY